MDREVAERISVLMLRISAELDQSIALVRDTCSDEQFKKYRRAVAEPLGLIHIDIMEYLWREHPDLRPAAMDGPYEVDATIYEPMFYDPNPEGGDT